MMTVHALHAGDGYEYLTKQVASADRERVAGEELTDYYAAHGTPAGQWYGTGAEALGISGDVTEAHMKALFGEGLHPDADAIIAREIAAGKTVKEAIATAKLGSTFYDYATKKSPVSKLLGEKIDAFTAEHTRRPTPAERAELRTDAAREHFTTEHGRKPNREETNALLAEEKRGSRQAVAGFDCVFTPQKSVSMLWGLGDDDTRRLISRCHHEAVSETLDWAQEHFAVTRRGKNGVRQIDADGLVIARFDHYDNRDGDMNIHTHAVVSGKVRGSDGKWSALDARPLHAGRVSLSSRYNATITAKIRREGGFDFEERSRGRGKQPVLEVVGIDNNMIGEFSRRGNIVARTEELAAQYRDKHGHNPSKAVQIQLAQQATLDTRNAKPMPKSLREMVTEWSDRARRFLGDGRDGAQFITDLHYQHTHPDALLPYDAERVALRVGVDTGGKMAVLTDETRLAESVRTELARCTFTSASQRRSAENEVRRLLSDSKPGGFLDTVDDAHAAQQRMVFEPAVVSADVLDTVARRRATWTEANLRSAVEDRVGLCHFDTEDEHRHAVEQIVADVRDRHSIRLTIDPDETPKALQRRNGESEFTVTGTARYTSEAVLAGEERLRAAANTPTTEFLTGHAVDAAIAHIEATEGRTLNEGQTAIARHLCTSGQELSVVVGPAGTGKTTAMKAVAHAWLTDGRDLLTLGPSKSAARVLGEELGVPGQTIAKLLHTARAGGDTGITAGAMLLVDEAGMAATADLVELQNLARDHGAIVRWIGDPYQLAAVESGGALRMLANDTHAPELSTVVRFGDDERGAAEAKASLAVRAGDATTAWEFYDNHGRVHDGMVDELREQILTRHLDDTAHGRSSLMLAATTADVSALNNAAQTAHALDGTVKTGGGHVMLADGSAGCRGDIVVTRLNRSRLRVSGGGKRNGTSVDNGDLWTLEKIHKNGSITVRGRDHHGTVNLPATYVKDHVELGYASTVHRAQGMTVKRAYLLMNTTLGRSLAYVGLTRGSDENHAFIATDALPDPAMDHQSSEPISPLEGFARVLAREDDNLTATEVMRAEQAHIDDPQRLRGIYEHATGLLSDEHGRFLLDRALPAVLFAEAAKSPHLRDLLDTIAIADAHHLDTRALVTAIASNHGEDLGESLATARDVGAVLRARADEWIAERVRPAGATLAGVDLDTLAHTPGSEHALTGAVAAVNRTDTAAIGEDPQRFRALRDLPQLSTLALVPARHTGADTELSDYAQMLRTRILETEIDRAAPPRPARETGRPITADPQWHAARNQLRDELEHIAPGAARLLGDEPIPADPTRPAGTDQAGVLTLDRAAPAYIDAVATLENAAAARAALAHLHTDADTLAADPSWERLRDVLADANRRGLDIDTLTADTVRELDPRSTDRLLDVAHTIATETADTPGAVPEREGAPMWLPAPPPIDETAAGHELAQWAREGYDAIANRTQELGAQVGQDQPDWTAHLGPVPAEDQARAQWLDTAAQIAAYREEFAITTDREVLGGRPEQPELRDAWDTLTDEAKQLRRTTAEQLRHTEQQPAPEHQLDADRDAEVRRLAAEQAEQHHRMINRPEHGHDYGPSL